MYILAHDLGTSGNKATLFDESGLLIASRTAAYPTDYASGNRAEQNPHHWWKAIVDTTQALLELVSPNDIAGVALSGQMMGCLCVDKDGNPLRPHMLYCDQRSQEEEAKLTEKIDPLHFYEITGHRISASYSVEKLMWVKKHEPEIFAQTAKMLNAKDYINYRLCGTIATDPSDASGTNAYDLNRWQWSEEIIEAAELDLSLFPEVRSSIDVIGEITNEAARETGLLAGTPVICGGGDGSCAGVGVGCVAPGTAYNYLGSSSWVALTVEKPIVDEQRRTMTGAAEVLKEVEASGLQRLVVTGSGQHSLIDKLNHTYPGHFNREKMVTAFDVKYGKPHPEPYLMGLQKAHVKPNEAFVVENAPMGVEAAVAANIFTIAVNTGPLPDQVLLDAGADLLYPDMENLAKDWKQIIELAKSTRLNEYSK